MKRLLIGVMVLGSLFMGIAANAESWSDDFSGGSRNAALWDYMRAGDNSYLEQSGGTLNYHNAPPNGDYAIYTSKWTVDFTKDFQFSVDFNNAYSGPREAGLDLGLLRFDQTHSPTLTASVSASNLSQTNQQIYRIAIEDWDYTVNPFWEGQGDRSGIDSGRIFLEYTTLNDTLKFYAIDASGQGSAEYQGFKKDFGLDPMNVYLGGWADGAAEFNGSLDNFSGNVAPEPVSSALFLIGGAALAVRRYRKKAIVNG